MKDQVTGILDVGVNVARMWELISKYRLAKDRYAYVVDSQGTLLAYQDVSSVLGRTDLKNIDIVKRLMNSEIGVYEYKGLEGNRVIGANAVIPLTGWGVIVEEPLEKAYRDLYILSAVFMSIFLLTVALALIMGLRFSFRSLVHPLRRLQEQAAAFAQGNFDHRLSIARPGELRQLSEAFNRMAADLQQTTVSRDLLVAEIEERRRTAKELEYRLKFEELITGISTKFINLPTDAINNGIDQALRAIGEFAQVDRSYMFRFYEDGTKMDNTHEWCSPGTEPYIQRLKGLLVEGYHWSMEPIKRGETVHVPRVSDPPPEATREREDFEKQGIQSIILVPMAFEGCVGGFLGFDSVREEKTWSEDIISLLKIIGEIFANAIQREQAVEALHESEERYRSFFENCPVFLWEMDSSECKRHLDQLLASGIENLRAHLLQHPDEIMRCLHEIRVLDVNHAAVRMLGARSKEQVMEEYASIFLPKTLEGFAEWLATIPSGESEFETESVVRAFTGEVRHVVAKVMPLPERPTGMLKELGSVIDITERKRTEGELLNVQKLESVGVLAGGIAHDFNNLLGVILGGISLAKLDMNPETRVFKVLQEAEKACHQSRNLTQQLITFSKGGAPVRKLESIEKILGEAINLALAGSNVLCTLHIDDDAWPVNCDSGQIQQVFMNLLINAKEAMPEGQAIEIETRNVKLREGEIPSLGAGSYVKISVKDYGTGIPEDHLPRIFDPYFSTKERGARKGTGLGLTIAYGILKRHEGHISVHSKVGVGTTFHVYLPAQEGGVLEIPEAESIAPKRKGKILLMDDEPMLRDMAGLLLNHLGYEVEQAQDGAEAIQVFIKAKESDKPFDAVILDLTVRGGMGGKEAVKKLLEIDSSVKAIVSSGYSHDPIIAKFREYGFSGALVKPYRLRELQETLEEVISNRLV
jgi:PAS domain S-box-containing protein